MAFLLFLNPSFLKRTYLCEQMETSSLSFPYYASEKVLYVHGFASSGASGTVKSLRLLLPQAEIVAPDVPVEPLEAMRFLQELCAAAQPALIIGTSLGGMYAEQFAGFDRILVNPSFETSEVLRKNNRLGRHEFHNPRRDGQKDFLVTKGTLESFKAVEENSFSAIDAAECARVFGLFGTEDDVVDTYALFAAHYPNALRFEGGHYLNDHSLVRAVMPVVGWLDDRRTGKERPVLYIDFAALQNERGEARPGAVKAFETLARVYDVYVVAENLVDTAFLGVPAYRRLVVTPRYGLLYGDYLLTPRPADDFLGTPLRFGEDPFKTWDDALIYFERLGGQ